MSTVIDLHSAIKRGDVTKAKLLLEADRGLANSRSETDPRGTYPLHVAAEFGQAAVAQILLDFGADVSLLDLENDAVALVGPRSSAGREWFECCSTQSLMQASATNMGSRPWRAQWAGHKASEGSSPMPQSRNGSNAPTQSKREGASSERKCWSRS